MRFTETSACDERYAIKNVKKPQMLNNLERGAVDQASPTYTTRK